MQYTPKHALRLPQNNEAVLVGDLNYNANKIDGLLSGDALTLGTYSTAGAHAPITGAMTVAEAVGQLDYRSANSIILSDRVQVSLFYQPATTPSNIAARDTVTAALGKLEYKTNNMAAWGTLGGYVPPRTGEVLVPVASTDSINNAFKKLMAYINYLEARVSALENP